MRWETAPFVTLGFVGAFAAGLWVGPRVGFGPADARSPAFTAGTDAAQPRTTPAPSSAPAPSLPAAQMGTSHPALAIINVAEPRLQERLKSLLSPGTDMNKAAAGFRSAEQFATVAHAARNTNVPFVLLKTRMLDKGETLTQAIRDSNPSADAAFEVARARAEARSLLASIGSTRG